MSTPASRRRLARIRCLQECIQCFREQKKFPESLCYVPSEVEYSCTGKTVIKVYGETKKTSKKIRDLVCTSNSRIYASGEEYCNSSGKWLKIKKFKTTQTSDPEEFDSDVWILLYGGKSSTYESPTVVPSDSIKKPFYEQNKINSWEEVVEHTCSVAFPNKSLKIVPPDENAVKKLRDIPVNWTMEHDEALVRLMSHHIFPENDQLGTIKNYVDSIDVSSYSEKFGPSSLTDGDPDTYWESAGRQGHHWIQLRMKKGTIIKKLQITVEGSDDNYLPSRLVIQGGEADNLKTLNTISVDWEIHDSTDITVLENMTEHFPVVTICIKECKAGGTDTRIHGIKITSTEGRAYGFDRDFFKGDNLIRYPKLETYSPDELYRRFTVLQRFMTIVDSVLQYVLPTWEYSTGSYSSLEYVRQILPLSKKRFTLIETFLKETSSDRPPEMPKLYINRRAAMEHRCNPTQDPECKNSIFMQIYEGLKPRDRNTKPLNYRWSFHYDQWWECEFLLEGVIDQGGGFRDSLSDLAEELCPSSTEGPVPLPFFIRSPNQFCDDSNINRDVYIPNPSCKDFSKYEWIGQLMGACMRGRENLVLTLPSFVWKKLVGERVTWSRDYHTVDAAEVKMVDSLAALDIEIFKAAERTWSMVLCDGTVTMIKMDDDCNPMLLKYEDREKYAAEVRKIRMIELNDQINAIRRGLLKVVPQAVLDLLTWQELEHRICGDPEITIEALRKATHYEYLEENVTRVKYLWEALTNFSNDDRSRFLRFVTGRRRMPAPFYISTGKGDMIDHLPESSTCSNIFYLPSFSSAKDAEEKIRYAAYNCIDIDTDMNVWED